VFSKPEIEGLIDQLTQRGYLKSVGGKYPVLRLTPQGEAAIQSKADIALLLPRQLSPEEVAVKKAERQAGGTVAYTAQLIASSFSPEQIAIQRGLTLTTILGHLTRLITAGEVDVDKVVPRETRLLIEAAIRQVGSVQYLLPIKELLPEEIDYNIIRCVVEAWKLKK
jgi:DNA-binding MarR family transcriptional regulator